MSARTYTLLADLVLLLHFGIVAFVIGGFVVIWIGYFRQWQFVRNWWFRLTHLGVMTLVAVQAYSDLFCPLTVWENRLRELAGQAAPYDYSCIEYWVGRVLYYDIPPVVFQAAYLGFLALLVVTMLVVRPTRKPLEHKK